jgi:hypothetical protein
VSDFWSGRIHAQSPLPAAIPAVSEGVRMWEELLGGPSSTPRNR